MNVEDNRIIWHATVTTAKMDMIGIRKQITAQVGMGLLPLLGAATPADSGTHPRNEEAYDLYLRSVAVPHDAASNKEAIAVLERAVGMDPNYAPTWEQLGLRYYYDATYSDGGEKTFQRSNNSYERTLALDPNRLFAAGSLITNRVERGELAKAYEAAAALVKRRPESAQAHFTLGYVLRYAGMLEESSRECDTALSLDPGNYTFRSCAWSFMELGKFDRAMNFVQLDAGSEWFASMMPALLLREGKVADARQAVKHMPAVPYHRDLLVACLQGPTSELDRMAREAETSQPSDPDPELSYYQGSIFAFCGKKEAAIHMLKSAVEQNYCAYSNLRSDPLLAKLRGTPEFSQLLSTAKECQNTVLAERNKSSR